MSNSCFQNGFRSLGVTGLLVLLGACGPKGLEIGRGVHPDQIDPFYGQKSERRIQARIAARGASLKCTIEGECDPAVALVAVATDEGLERCSGVLISENQVLTNDHCVDKSLSLLGWETRHRKLPCSGTIFLHFAGDDERTSQHAGCSEIEFRSGESGINSQDYAIIRMDRPIRDRKPLKISKRGFRDQEKVRILRVQMDRGSDTGFGGTQSFLSCQASLSTYLYPMLNSSETPLMTFGDCTVQAGNSGAPVVNEEGELGGLVQGYLTFKQGFEMEKELKDMLLDESYGLVGIGSQTRCMSELNPDRSGSCRSIPPFTHFSPKTFLDIFGEFDELVLPTLDSNENWSPVPTNSSVHKRYFSAPVCSKSERFESLERNYRKGINHRLQSEWRVDPVASEIKTAFSSQNSSAFGGTTFVSSDGVILEVPTCR